GRGSAGRVEALSRLVPARVGEAVVTMTTTKRFAVRRRFTARHVALLAAAATAVGGAAVGAGASSTTGPLAVQHVLTSASVHNDVSAPLRDMKLTWPTHLGFSHEQSQAAPTTRARVKDGALQTSATTSSALQVLGSFHGI